MPVPEDEEHHQCVPRQPRVRRSSADHYLHSSQGKWYIIEIQPVFELYIKNFMEINTRLLALYTLYKVFL